MGGLLLALAVVLGLLAGCSRDVEAKPPAPSTDASGDRAALAQQALERLRTGLSGGSRDSVVALGAGSGGAELLGEVFDNAAALRIEGLQLRYVDEGDPLDEDQRSRFGARAWTGSVDLEYRYGGVDTAAVRVETQVVLVPEGGRARIASFGGAGTRTPLWLEDRLTVVRTARTLVAVGGVSARRYPGLATRAVEQVLRVLPAWKGVLVVEVPESQQQLDQVVQASPGQYDNIAAVTTTADGSLAGAAPVRVFVNPAVFGGLKPRGAQVVLSHEATHVAARAPFASMPTWLLEGFADYVALDGAGIPVSLAAGQILRRIRTDGLPRGLPSAKDLDPTANGLGATYEEAWLACRYLGERYGTARLVAFYDAVDGGASLSSAFGSVLGTTQRAFVAGWRRDLAGLAGVTG